MKGRPYIEDSSTGKRCTMSILLDSIRNNSLYFYQPITQTMLLISLQLFDYCKNKHLIISDNQSSNIFCNRTGLL